MSTNGPLARDKYFYNKNKYIQYFITFCTQLAIVPTRIYIKIENLVTRREPILLIRIVMLTSALIRALRLFNVNEDVDASIQ